MVWPAMALLCTAVMAISSMTFQVSAENTEKVVWDMEDASSISSCTTVDAQKATWSQSTKFHHSGNASLMMVNTGGWGLVGWLRPLENVDFTGYDSISVNALWTIPQCQKNRREFCI